VIEENTTMVSEEVAGLENIPVVPTNESVVADYSDKLFTLQNYEFSTEKARHRYAESQKARQQIENPVKDEEINFNSSGIPEVTFSDIPTEDDEKNKEWQIQHIKDNPQEAWKYGEEDVDYINYNGRRIKKKDRGAFTNLYLAAPDWAQKIVYPLATVFLKDTEESNPILRGAASGLVQGFNNVLEFARDINNAMPNTRKFKEEEWWQIPKILESNPDSTTEGVINGLSQFIGVYTALGKISKTKDLKNAPKKMKILDDMWRGAIADAMFDPEEGNLATLINMLDDDTTAVGVPVGKWKGPLTEWLGTPVGEDADAYERLEQRAKNLLEGATIGFAVHTLMHMLKGTKDWMLDSDPEMFWKVLKQLGISDQRIFAFQNTRGVNAVQAPADNIGMYSQLEEAILNMPMEKNQAGDVLRYLKKNGVTANELDDSGVGAFLREAETNKTPVTKTELAKRFEKDSIVKTLNTETFTQGSNVDAIELTDEDELLNVYQYEREGGDPLIAQDEIAGFNGRVLDHDEMYDNISSHADDIRHELETGSYDDYDATSIRTAMAELYPDKYGRIETPKDFDEFNLKLGSMYGGNNYKPELHPNPEEFRQHVDEAADLVAKQNYDEAPVYRWEVSTDEWSYEITGNEDYGYSIDITDVSTGSSRSVDNVGSVNEAQLRIRQHEIEFGNYSHEGSAEFGQYVNLGADMSTYKETIITAESPSNMFFEGGHYDADDVVLHLRTTERIDSAGEKVLFIEELQSDWAEEGFKRGFVKGSEKKHYKDIKDLNEELGAAMKARDEFLEKNGWKMSFDTPMRKDDLHPVSSSNVPSEIKDVVQKVDKIREKLRTQQNLVAPMPMKDKWMQLGMKRAIQMAINGGVNRIAWTNSADQISRWGKGTNGKFEEMFVNLYDKKMVGYAKRLANKYNSKIGKGKTIMNQTRYFLEISPEMKDVVEKGRFPAYAVPVVPIGDKDKEDKS